MASNGRRSFKNSPSALEIKQEPPDATDLQDLLSPSSYTHIAQGQQDSVTLALTQSEQPLPGPSSAPNPASGHLPPGDGNDWGPVQPEGFQAQNRPLIVPSQGPAYTERRAQGYTGDRHAGPGPVRRDRRVHGQGPAAAPARAIRRAARPGGVAAEPPLPYDQPPFAFQGGFPGPSSTGYFPHGQPGGDRVGNYPPRPVLLPASGAPTVTQAGPSNVRRLPPPPAFQSAPYQGHTQYGGAPQGQFHPAPTHAYGFPQMGPPVQHFPPAGNPPFAPQGYGAGPSAPHPVPAAPFVHGLLPNPAPSVQPQPGPSTAAAGPSIAPPANGYECGVCHTYFDDRIACGHHVLVDHVFKRFSDELFRFPSLVRAVPRRQT